MEETKGHKATKTKWKMDLADTVKYIVTQN